jgi:hypothetical protein
MPLCDSAAPIQLRMCSGLLSLPRRRVIPDRVVRQRTHPDTPLLLGAHTFEWLIRGDSSLRNLKGRRRDLKKSQETRGHHATPP